ncbi:MAG TPA: DNA translocase FtsK 4TM domain-containing protein, partial [Crenalkalicoccus sp.]|nr:DNA translocase FtsK 4TM domain-containing protein [Crenalkalicoccus sp.]
MGAARASGFPAMWGAGCARNGFRIGRSGLYLGRDVRSRMARAAADRMNLAGVRRFASPAVKAALRRRGAELLGILAGLAGLALLVALASYDPADPSLS